MIANKDTSVYKTQTGMMLPFEMLHMPDSKETVAEANRRMIKAKPFVKWVGGKTQLISQLEALLPEDFSRWNNVTYIEPFVGGGAMLFYMLQNHPNITRAVINDINPDLICCYQTIKYNPHTLIEALEKIECEYHTIADEEQKKQYYLERRTQYNTKQLTAVENSALFIFLNRTCFNGLYRVNKSGLFNVPFGRYDRPTICDRDTIMADSRLLQHVDIMCGDFEETLSKATDTTLFYFDPPYRPLNNTSSFNDYAKDAFNDHSQRRLKQFCDTINARYHHFMLSNSDCMAKSHDPFFDHLYANYDIQRVYATRSVNANPMKRGRLTEIVVRNFSRPTN